MEESRAKKWPRGWARGVDGTAADGPAEEGTVTVSSFFFVLFVFIPLLPAPCHKLTNDLPFEFTGNYEQGGLAGQWRRH